MSGDTKVTEYLNKALRHELTVVKSVLAALSSPRGGVCSH
jgi:hypothetical protein